MRVGTLQSPNFKTFLKLQGAQESISSKQFRQAVQPGGPVQQPYSYSVPSPHRLFQISSKAEKADTLTHFSSTPICTLWHTACFSILTKNIIDLEESTRSCLHRELQKNNFLFVPLILLSTVLHELWNKTLFQPLIHIKRETGSIVKGLYFYRVPEFLTSRLNWVPLPPQASVSPPLGY